MSEVNDRAQSQSDWNQLAQLYRTGLLTDVHNAVVKRLPKVGFNYVTRTLLAPSRITESSPKSSAGRFPSRKLGRSIGFESATIEYPTALKKERDSNCIALLDQGQAIRLRARSANRWVSYWHRPDFVCIEESRVTLIECKSLDGIEKKNAINPGFFVYEGGRWICPSAVEEAKRYGFEYEVWTEMEFTDIELRNAKVVDAYLCGATKTYDVEIEMIRRHLAPKTVGLSIAELLEELRDEVSVDAIYAAIAREAIAFDLTSSPLTTHSTCRVFSDATTLKAYQLALAKPLVAQQCVDAGGIEFGVGMQVMWNAARWRCISLADGKLTLAPNADIQPIPLHAYQPLSVATFLVMVRSGEMTVVDSTPRGAASDSVASHLQSANQLQLQEANRRYALVVPFLAPDAKPAASRTIRRYIESYRRALEQLGNGYVGLLPGWDGSGNREVRIVEPVMGIVQRFINQEYLTPERPSMLSVYRRILGELEPLGHIAPSYRWFCRLIKAIPPYESMLARTGRKGAYTFEPRVNVVDRHATPVAERAFELAHIDHTKIDVVSSTDGPPVRLWLTVMMCSATRRVLSFALSFESPSYRQVMLVMRECVKRHNRLPESIMVDGGKEFHSVWFETLCAVYHVVVRRRPKSKARFGAQMERLFGTTNTNLFHTLVGNTQNTKNVRQLTPEVDPYRSALWTAGHLKTLVDRFYFEDYDQKIHTGLNMSPRQAAASSQAAHGKSPHRFLSYDETFLILTSASTRKGTALVQPDGVKINYLYFNHPNLRFHIGANFPVRYDPFNLANAWAYVNGAWLKLTSRFASTLINHSEHDVGVVTAAWRNTRSATESRVLSEPHLVRLLRELETQETWLSQRQLSLAERRMRESEDATSEAVAMSMTPVVEPPEFDPPKRAQKLKLAGKLVALEVLQ